MMDRLTAAITPAANRPVKVLQFGEGNFLRAFVDYFIDIANEQTDFNGSIVLVKPITFGSLGMFHEQDCRYTVMLRGLVDGEAVEQSRLIPKYPRGHMGHSIGCSAGPEEFPQISPNNDRILQENMVVCLETPYSGAGDAPVHGGFNLEDTHLITKDGHESFTTMPDNIFWK